mgnify:CR=1 FL=1
MSDQDMNRYIAFEGRRCIASGPLVEVAIKVKEAIDHGEQGAILIFDDSTSELVEVDFRGAVDEVLTRLRERTVEYLSTIPPTETDTEVRRGPGRPKLGVVSREVTLLPRHWDWLNSQPGGASVALRKLVEEARRVNRQRDKVRFSQETTYRFMSAMAGNEPGFEEATRALFAGDPERFRGFIYSWPVDIRDHVQKLAEIAFQK